MMVPGRKKYELNQQEKRASLNKMRIGMRLQKSFAEYKRPQQEKPQNCLKLQPVVRNKMHLTLTQKDETIDNLSRRFREKHQKRRQVKLDGISSPSSLTDDTDCKIDELNTPTELRSSFNSLLRVNGCKWEDEYPCVMKQSSSLKPGEEKLEKTFSVGKPPWPAKSALNNPHSNEILKNRTVSSIAIKDTKARSKGYRRSISKDLLYMRYSSKIMEDFSLSAGTTKKVTELVPEDIILSQRVISEPVAKKKRSSSLVRKFTGLNTKGKAMFYTRNFHNDV